MRKKKSVPKHDFNIELTEIDGNKPEVQDAEDGGGDPEECCDGEEWEVVEGDAGEVDPLGQSRYVLRVHPDDVQVDGRLQNKMKN